MNNSLKRTILIGNNNNATMEVNTGGLEVITVSNSNITIIPKEFSLTFTSYNAQQTLSLFPFQPLPLNNLPEYLTFDRKYKTTTPFTLTFPTEMSQVVMDIFGLVIPANSLSGLTINYVIQDSDAFVFQPQIYPNLIVKSKSNSVNRSDVISPSTRLVYPNGFNGDIILSFETLRGTPLLSDSPLVFIVSLS